MSTKKNQPAAKEPAKVKWAGEIPGAEKQVKSLHTRIKNLENQLLDEKTKNNELKEALRVTENVLREQGKAFNNIVNENRKMGIRIAGFQRSHRLVEQAIVLARATSVELGEQEYDKTRIFDDMHATCNITSNGKPGPENKSS